MDYLTKPVSRAQLRMFSAMLSSAFIWMTTNLTEQEEFGITVPMH